MTKVHDLLHVNIRVPESMLAQCREFYCGVLGLNVGWRPPLESRGYWLYAGRKPVVQLVEIPATAASHSPARGHSALDHVALSCSDLPTTLARLRKFGVSYQLSTVPDLDYTQVAFTDPCGVGIVLSFDPAGAVSA